jgi:hypothetical protein
MSTTSITNTTKAFCYSSGRFRQGGDAVSVLAVVQCDEAKIWRRSPEMGSVPAKDAYTSPYFRKQCEYARRTSDRWVILSAKYGYLNPDEPIQDYDVSFKKKSTRPISFGALRQQARSKGLTAFNEVVVLGGKEYLQAVEESFPREACAVRAPFKGLRIGERMTALDTPFRGLDED